MVRSDISPTVSNPAAGLVLISIPLLNTDSAIHVIPMICAITLWLFFGQCQIASFFMPFPESKEHCAS